MTRPLFLITNDDGIHADGLKHLCSAASEFADLAIVAPDEERSGSSLAITWSKPLYVKKVSWADNILAWSVSGTPADCVKMALSSLLPRQPDLILSGVNKGSNAGRTIFYSGTVGGVIEGALRGLPGIAFSFYDFAFPPIGSVQELITGIIKYCLATPLRSGSILNVNFPQGCEKSIKGVRLAKQGRGSWMESPEKRLHPEGIPYYWLGGRWEHCEEDADSDLSLLKAGYVAATPIFVGEMTDHQVLAEHRASFEESFKTASLCANSINSRPPGRT